ncbi:22088_t:CDS:2, partial [Racocetra persica]
MNLIYNRYNSQLVDKNCAFEIENEVELFDTGDPNGMDVRLSAIQELNTLMKSFIAKHTLKHNQEATCKNSKRILLAKSQNVENFSDISCDSDSDSNYNDN